MQSSAGCCSMFALGVQIRLQPMCYMLSRAFEVSPLVRHKHSRKLKAKWHNTLWVCRASSAAPLLSWFSLIPLFRLLVFRGCLRLLKGRGVQTRVRNCVLLKARLQLLSL